MMESSQPAQVGSNAWLGSGDEACETCKYWKSGRRERKRELPQIPASCRCICRFSKVPSMDTKAAKTTQAIGCSIGATLLRRA